MAKDVLAGFREELAVLETSAALSRRDEAESSARRAYAAAATASAYTSAVEGAAQRLRHRIEEAEGLLSPVEEKTPGHVALTAYAAHFDLVAGGWRDIGQSARDSWEAIAAAVLAHGRGER